MYTIKCHFQPVADLNLADQLGAVGVCVIGDARALARPSYLGQRCRRPRMRKPLPATASKWLYNTPIPPLRDTRVPFSRRSALANVSRVPLLLQPAVSRCAKLAFCCAKLKEVP